MNEEAKRDPVKYRYDVLDWNFIFALARIGYLGAEKYGDFNYRQSGLVREKSPTNHMIEHFRQYMENRSYDHLGIGTERKWHLAAIAFNAMIEFYHEEHPAEELLESR